MGINACILKWFGEMAEAGIFEGKLSILELGPQDFFFPESAFEKIAESRLGSDSALQLRNAIFREPTPYDERQALFYSAFGLEQYASVDTYDDRATFRQNLNVADVAPEKFDVVVDCGTTEHVFNLANVFVYTHNTLKIGGIALKVLPTFGDNGHGFYNIHPTVYFDIARENGYDILDFRYVDDMISRSETRGAESLLSQSELTTGLQSFAGCAAIQEKVSRSFLQTLIAAEREGRLPNSHNSVDYCFVAMRKNRDAAFRYPGQGVYLSEFPPSAHE